MKFALYKACKFNDLGTIVQDNKGVVKIAHEEGCPAAELANWLTFVQPMLLYRFFPFIAALLLLPQLSSGQQLTGIWKGYFVTKDQSQYKIEL
ncbi:MAG: hypothetical protein EB101_06135, partial [Chitinophagia bacterium]|nr:hypothetical protein [Chitinophagia bacterium]